MSKINNQTNSSSSLLLSSGSVHERWRLIKDKIARYGVIAGGLGIIFAIALIFFYLLYVVYPLFISASAEPVAQYSVPETSNGKTLLLEIEEQNEVAARFTESGQVIFFSVSNGNTILKESVKVPDGTKIVSFSQGSPINEGAVIYGLSDGRAIIVKHQYKVSYPNNVRLITPSLSYPLGEAPLLIDDTGAALENIAVKIGDKSSTIVAKTAANAQGNAKIHLSYFEKSNIYLLMKQV